MLRPIAMAAATALLAGCISIEEHRAGPAPAPAAPAAAYSLPFGEGSRAASEQPAGDYVLDGRHASVTWRLRHAGVGIFVARFDTITGKLTFDSANPANSSISVTIPANSVNTGVLDRNGARAFDTDIHTQAFGSAAHPEIKFVSRSIAVTGPNTGTIVGDLTLKGVTKPVTIDATFEGGRFLAFRSTQMIAFTGRTVINRKDFGASLSNPLADGFAGDQVEILIAAEFLKE
jgi:polyisoprenoid-binding protein YceI